MLHVSLARGGGRSAVIVVTSSSSICWRLALRRRGCGATPSPVVSGAYSGLRRYSCFPIAHAGLCHARGSITNTRLFSASKDTETTAAKATTEARDGLTEGADRDAGDASTTEFPKPRSGINLPPPPPPLSDTSNSVKVTGRFYLPPPPPINIAGIDRIGSSSATSNLQSSAHVKSVAGTNVEGGSSGSKGPKKISIDDILSSGSSATAPGAIASASSVDDEASPKTLPDANNTESLKGSLGSSISRPTMPFDGDKDCDVTNDNEDEHVEAHVTFHPFTTTLSPSQQRELEDSRSRSENDGEAIFSSTSGEGRSAMLPQADLSGLLPNHVNSVEFRSESILSSMDDSFATVDDDKDEPDKSKMNMNVKARIEGHVPGAYRVREKKSAGSKEKKYMDSRRGKTAYPFLHPSEIRSIQDGPGIRYGTDKIASLAKGSVMAASGATVVMSTVVHESSAEASSSSFAEIEARGIANAVKAQCRKHSGMLPLTVTYTERHAGVGKIPSNQARRDNMRPSESETLAARAIDRALRPLLPKEYYSLDDAIEINCSVQACGRLGDGAADGSEGSGDPLAVAINSASVAMLKSGLPFTQPVGAVRLCLDYDGAVIFDPSSQQIDDSQLDLLVAATRDDIVMIEFGGKPPRAYRDGGNDEKRKGKQQANTIEAAIYVDRDPGIPEDVVADLFRISHASIQKIIDEQMADNEPVAAGATPSDSDLIAELGLNIGTGVYSPAELGADHEFQELTAQAIIEEAFHFVSDKLSDAALCLFGKTFNSEGNQESINYATGALIHSGASLLPKSVRGRREHLVRREILRLLVDEFVPETDSLRSAYQDAVLSDESALDVLTSSVHERLLKKAMHDSAVELGTRGDGRAGPNHQGLLTVRPIESTVPLLPDVVHGSSLFSRGETQVMCTTTLGAPREGQPVTNPYASSARSLEASKECENGPYSDLPVGSLRFLKNQQALESDLNTKRIRADREMTGDSGILRELRRAFFHYDMPSHSTGEVQKGGPTVNRRAVGHGNLAERGLLPILPPPAVFPYSIRMTSEVTSSNGSSSMASVCGATLALLDSGVPILAPAAGVSVGLVRGEIGEEESYGLLLDITGTEDFYGEMDFKLCGTESGLTAMQLDVKSPLPLDIIIEAMQVAKEGRRAILSSMKQSAMESSGGVIQNLKPRRKPKHTAPRVEVVRFDPVRKRDLIGPGGAVLKQLEDRYGVSLDLSQEGQCLLYGADASVVSKAKAAVMDLVADVEEGEVYEGTVIEIKDFGAVVELLRNKKALLHISELGDREGAEMTKRQHPDGNLGLVRRELEIGQNIRVLCIGVDPVQGDIKVSRKKLLRQELAA